MINKEMTILKINKLLSLMYQTWPETELSKLSHVILIMNIFYLSSSILTKREPESTNCVHNRSSYLKHILFYH